VYIQSRGGVFLPRIEWDTRFLLGAQPSQELYGVLQGADPTHSGSTMIKTIC